MSKLFLMMGAPGSGKSTWIKRQLTEKDMYISRDEVRFSFMGASDGYFDNENEVFNEFIRRINDAIAKGYKRIFADATHLTKISRAKVIHKITEYVDEINVIWLKTPLMECYRRNDNREGLAKVPHSVIKSMYDKIQEPSANEGIHKVYIIDGGDRELKVLTLGEKNKENFIF